MGPSPPCKIKPLAPRVIGRLGQLTPGLSLPPSNIFLGAGRAYGCPSPYSTSHLSGGTVGEFVDGQPPSLCKTFNTQPMSKNKKHTNTCSGSCWDELWRPLGFFICGSVASRVLMSFPVPIPVPVPVFVPIPVPAPAPCHILLPGLVPCPQGCMQSSRRAKAEGFPSRKTQKWP